jgi:hypothetical protein
VGADEPDRKQSQADPPGDFVTDDLRAQTAQFLDDLRKRIRREKADPGPKLGPPRK